MALSPRAIVQCDKDGNDIRYFPSVKEACIELGIANKEHIYRSIKYGVVAYDCRWRYADEPLVEPVGFDMRLKPVIAAKDNVEEEYPSIVSASKATGASISHIQEAILTGGVAKGYRFYLAGTSPKQKKPRFRKAVVAIDEDNNILKEWPSAYDAALDLGVNLSAIYLCINPKRRYSQCKGYRLKYKDDLNKS